MSCIKTKVKLGLRRVRETVQSNVFPKRIISTLDRVRPTWADVGLVQVCGWYQTWEARRIRCQ